MTHDGPMTESTQHEDEAIKSAIVAALDMLPTPLFLSAVAVDRSTEFIIAGKQSYHLVADVDMVGPEKTVHLLVSAIRDYYSYYEDRRVTVKDDPRTAAGSAVTHDPLCARTPTGVHYVGTCTCNLIAKVRADTLNKAREAVVAVPWQSSMLGATVMRGDVVAAVDSLVATATPARALKPDR